MDELKWGNGAMLCLKFQDSVQKMSKCKRYDKNSKRFHSVWLELCGKYDLRLLQKNRKNCENPTKHKRALLVCRAKENCLFRVTSKKKRYYLSANKQWLDFIRLKSARVETSGQAHFVW